jgi:DNA-directed RNA polymerase subunit RPC12/RpoP
MLDPGIFILYIGVMTIVCPECKNDKNIEQKDAEVGRWFECDYCGVSFEIVKVKPDGSAAIKIIEEEK